MKDYGIKRLSYRVIEKPDGWINLQVHHENKEVRKLIQRNKANPRYFLNHMSSYRRDNLRAKQWLSSVIEDYRDAFALNKVDITFH